MNQESKQVHCTILKQITKHDKLLSQAGKSRSHVQKSTKWYPSKHLFFESSKENTKKL